MRIIRKIDYLNPYSPTTEGSAGTKAHFVCCICSQIILIQYVEHTEGLTNNKEGNTFIAKKLFQLCQLHSHHIPTLNTQRYAPTLRGHRR